MYLQNLRKETWKVKVSFESSEEVRRHPRLSKGILKESGSLPDLHRRLSEETQTPFQQASAPGLHAVIRKQPKNDGQCWRRD